MKAKPAFPCLLLLVVVSSLLAVRSSQAVPAFARREGSSCSKMCHFRLPELNEDGHAYIRRGLREARAGMAAPAGMDKGMDKGMDMGTKDAAKTPVASSERPLGEPLPLDWRDYLTLMGRHTYEARDHEPAAFHPGMIDGWIGGPLDQRWSGVANFAIDIEAGGVGVEQAYAQVNTSWSPRFASLRFGQLLPFAVLFNEGGAAMPVSTPVILQTPSRARNPWVPTTLLRGIEVGVVDLPRGSAYVGVGQPQMEGVAGAGHTDVYVSAEYLVGQKGAISGFGYVGKIAASPGQPPIDYERVALFANAYLPRMKGVAGFLWGRDKPTGDKSLDTSGLFLLGEALLTERWAGYARYDYATRDAFIGESKTTDGPTIGVSFWAQTQVRLTLESQFLKSSGLSRGRSAIAELMWVF